MSDRLTRRQLLLAGVALALAGCGRSKPRTAVAQRPPPYEFGPGTPTGGATQAAAGGLWYQVAAGDTLSSIARRSRIEVDAIAESNGLTTAQLTPGQRLWLPGASALGDDPLARQGVAHEEEPDAADAPPAGGYRLVRRSEWTDNPVRGNNQPMGGVQRITVHHTGEHPGLEGISEIEVLRRIERYHQRDRGWAAIGYHYIVGRSGKVYEGRPAKFQGAHVSGANEHNLGISVVGDFMHKLPNQRQLAALDAFLTDMRMKHRVGKSRVYGHRDLGKSECCGDQLYRWVKAYRS